MATNLDKSLDEIIAQNPAGRRKGGRGGAPRAGRANAGGGIRKPTSRPAPQTRAVPRATQPAASSGIKLDANDKIIISNLPLDVQESAIKDYFALEIGAIKKCTLNYNSKGQSTGVVTMVFQKAGDAQRAWKRFNGTPIDNGKKIMHVELVVDPNRKTLADRIMVKPETGSQPAARKVTAARGRGTATRGGRGGKSGSARRPKKTVEQLDAEMTDYFVQAGTSKPTAAAAPVATTIDAGDIPM
ncbi:uncharacterized protein V1518DRAFT_426214 [Limtongia smithiae]|uniref:uncharacterized protein n=1 Tax=Limtongia smithiae TaxID=1125753 RepID=UPI0034CFEFE3